MSNYDKWQRAADRDALGDHLFLMAPLGLLAWGCDGWLRYAAIGMMVIVAGMATVKLHRLLKNKAG